MPASTRAVALTLFLVALGATPAFAADRLVAKPTDLACGKPTAYPTINAAVAAANPGDTIHVCPGVYQENVVIGKAGIKLISVNHWQAAIKFPSTAPSGGAPDAVVLIQAPNVLLQGFTVEGPWTDISPNVCVGSADRHYGVRVDSNGSAVIDDNHITEIEDNQAANRGCQDGVAVLVGRASQSTFGSAEIKNNVIDKYQKNGPTIDGASSSAKVHDNTIDGGENHDQIAKNGIQFGDGATGSIDHNRVFNNYYTGVGPPAAQDSDDSNDAAGIIIFSETGGLTVHDNTLYSNDLGLDIFTASGVQILNNTTNSNYYDGLRADSDAVGNLFQGNKSSANGTDGRNGHDCHDDSAGSGTAGTANTWKDNQGVTQTPPGICKPPK